MGEIGLQRKRTATPVRLHPPGGEAPRPATLLDVSPTGAFVEVDPPPEIGTALEIELPSPAGTLRLQGTVVRAGRMAKPLRHPRIEHLVVRVPGVGLRFEALAAEQSARLGRFLSALEES